MMMGMVKVMIMMIVKKKTGTMAVTMAMMKAMMMMTMKKKNGTAGQLGAVMVCISKTESPFSTLRHEHIGTGTGNSGDVVCGT